MYCRISLGAYKMQTGTHPHWYISALMLNFSIIICQRVTYIISAHTVHLIHLNNVHLRIKSSVCLIVVTESMVTYGWPSFKSFWQSVDNSNACSTHPTHRQACVVWNVCVSTLYKFCMILSLSCVSFEWFFPSAGTSNVCQKVSFVALSHLIC